MKQFGDITKLNGAELDPVDLIVGGSPCQDLSVAGKRAGLDGERSGLFMEMIRLIREMRGKTNGLYPKFALWENVPGAFSSNKGADFQAVLTEFVRVAEPDAPDVPMPEEGWPKSGVLLGANWSIAWRTHDAQFWGVPQRRRRIALVADFRGQSAPEILFEREGMRRNNQSRRKTRESTSAKTENCTGESGEDDIATFLDGKEIDPTLISRMTTATGRTQDGLVICYNGANITSKTNASNPQPGDPCHTLTNDGRNYVISFQERSGKPGGGKGILIQKDHVGALSTMNNQFVLYDAYQHHGWREGETPLKFGESSFGTYSESVATLRRKGGSVGDGSENLVVQAFNVRRLTPLECERLQGFPDGWTDIPGATDAKRYRALGNSIALPFWVHLAKRLVSIGGVRTIGSLFDGIGGFPLCFQRAGAETLWTSEIEPFCHQVVAIRFGCGA